MINYQLPEDLGTKNYVNVKFVNEKNEIYIKMVNIPRDEDGTIIQDEFDQILEGQLKGVENKFKIGSITFVTPGQEPNPDDVPDTIKDNS